MSTRAFIAAAFSCAGAMAGSCHFHSPFGKDNGEVCNKDPHVWDDINNIDVAVTCEGFVGKTVELSVKRVASWWPDAWRIVTQKKCSSDPCTFQVEFGIPLDFRVCDPSEKFYLNAKVNNGWLGTGIGDSNFWGCQFLPRNYQEDLQDCDSVTFPTSSSSLLLGSSRVEWALHDPDEWSGWDLEVYLYRHSSLVDPWWWVGETAARDEIIRYDLGDLGISTTLDAQWYAAAYYRRFGLFTVLMAQSEYFQINDQNHGNDQLCGFVKRENEYALTCCSSTGSSTNDVCRVGVGDVQIGASDLELAVTVERDMCDAKVYLRASPYLVVRSEVFPLIEPLSYEFSSLRELSWVPPLLSSSQLTAGALDMLSEAVLLVETSTTCDNNRLGLKVSLKGEISLLSETVAEQEALVLFESEAIQLPAIGTDTNTGADTNISPAAKAIPALLCTLALAASSLV